MAGHTARRSGLGSAGVVVEILQKVPHPCITIVGVGAIIKCLPSILFSVPLSFQTENIPHSHPGFLPEAPLLPLQVLFLPCYNLLHLNLPFPTVFFHTYPVPMQSPHPYHNTYTHLNGHRIRPSARPLQAFCTQHREFHSFHH